MKKVFRKELFIKDAGNVSVDKELIETSINTWVTACDGKEVVDNKIDCFIIHDDWCETVEE